MLFLTLLLEQSRQIFCNIYINTFCAAMSFEQLAFHGMHLWQLRRQRSSSIVDMVLLFPFCWCRANQKLYYTELKYSLNLEPSNAFMLSGSSCINLHNIRYGFTYSASERNSNQFKNGTSACKKFLATLIARITLSLDFNSHLLLIAKKFKLFRDDLLNFCYLLMSIMNGIARMNEWIS